MIYGLTVRLSEGLPVHMLCLPGSPWSFICTLEASYYFSSIVSCMLSAEGHPEMDTSDRRDMVSRTQIADIPQYPWFSTLPKTLPEYVIQELYHSIATMRWLYQYWWGTA